MFQLLSCVWLFCNSMGCSLPDSYVHRIPQVGILEWVAIPCSRGYSWLRDRAQVLALQADSLPSEPPGKCFSLLQISLGVASLGKGLFWLKTLTQLSVPVVCFHDITVVIFWVLHINLSSFQRAEYIYFFSVLVHSMINLLNDYVGIVFFFFFFIKVSWKLMDCSIITSMGCWISLL